MHCAQSLTVLLLGLFVASQASQIRVPDVRAIYLSSNNVPNEIVALTVNEDGTLSKGIFTPTGGNGGIGIAADGSLEPTDALASQDSLVVEGDHLFVVNAGSNTISMFLIDCDDPTHLTPVGSPVSTIGEFPNTIAVSKTLSLVCVANAGEKNGITCFKWQAAGLKPDGVGLRPFGLKQTTPPFKLDDAPTDIFFSNDLQVLYAMVGGNTLNDTGFVAALPIKGGLVSTKQIRSKPNGTNVLFGAIQVPGTEDIFVSDPSFGAAILNIGPNYNITLTEKTPIPGQIATCWAEYSSVTDTVWVTDPVTNFLYEMNKTTSAIVKGYNVTNPNSGLQDFVVPGRFLYAASPGLTGSNASVVVFDVSEGSGKAKQVQNYLIGGGVTFNSQGLSYYV